MLRWPLRTPLKLRNLLGADIHGLGQRVEILFQQREAHVGVGWVVPAVVEFAWIFLQVEQFALGAVVVADQFVALVADHGAVGALEMLPARGVRV